MRAVAEGDLVALHTHQTWPGNQEYVTMDFFRFDKQGKIVEHWDSMQEIPAETVLRAKVVIDHREASLAEAGDLLIPLREGLMTESHIHAELGEIVTGKKKGRTRDNEITLFKATGLAIQDVGTAYKVYQMAKEKGIGKEI